MALYDPDHKFTKEFDPEAFYAFAKSKHPEEGYNAANIYRCALAQFGFPGIYFKDMLPPGVYRAAVNRDATFGALAERLEACGYGGSCNAA